MVMTPSITSTALFLGVMGVSSNIVVGSSAGDTLTVGVSYIAFGMFMCLLRIVVDDTRSRKGIPFLLNLLVGGVISLIFGFGLFLFGAGVEWHLPLALMAIFIVDDIAMKMLNNGQSYLSHVDYEVKEFGKQLLKDFKDLL
jgi:hypothetical protein